MMCKSLLVAVMAFGGCAGLGASERSFGSAIPTVAAWHWWTEEASEFKVDKVDIAERRVTLVARTPNQEERQAEGILDSDGECRFMSEGVTIRLLMPCLKGAKVVLGEVRDDDQATGMKEADGLMIFYGRETHPIDLRRQPSGVYLGRAGMPRALF